MVDADIKTHQGEHSTSSSEAFSQALKIDQLLAEVALDIEHRLQHMLQAKFDELGAQSRGSAASNETIAFQLD